jgi:hypothetical protein
MGTRQDFNAPAADNHRARRGSGATFEQHCEGATAALHGCGRYREHERRERWERRERAWRRWHHPYGAYVWPRW